MVGDLGAGHVFQGPTRSQVFTPLLCILYMFCTHIRYIALHKIYIFHTISYNIVCISSIYIYKKSTWNECHLYCEAPHLWTHPKSVSGSDGRAAAESTRTAVHSVGSVVGTQLTSVIPKDFQRHQDHWLGGSLEFPRGSGIVIQFIWYIIYIYIYIHDVYRICVYTLQRIFHGFP